MRSRQRARNRFSQLFDATWRRRAFPCDKDRSLAIDRIVEKPSAVAQSGHLQPTLHGGDDLLDQAIGISLPYELGPLAGSPSFSGAPPAVASPRPSGTARTDRVFARTLSPVHRVALSAARVR
ncbi:hypothetical protein AOT83_23950 [Mycobacteroides sp. H001]|nr:hypothetical protein AOT86_05905 [Mycobacteroides sp. H072]KRQ55686.1 hypothetical protein AOT85_01855 [Mycobacteroides sp. H054]KRQ66294.1 hypothetical protein AOT83_23950 [Mycobacteroides sp. H001]